MFFGPKKKVHKNLKQTIMIENELFVLQQNDCQSKKYFTYTFKPITNATQQDFDVLTTSISLICDNEQQCKYSIILDCSVFTQTEFISRFWKLSFTKALSISNKSLDKFILITKSHLLKTLSTPIILLKKASKYTFIVHTMEDALNKICN